MHTENRIVKSIETSIKNIQEIIDVNTIIGKPIVNSTGKIVIPITKLTLAILTGGGEYGKVSLFKKSDDLPYSAGNGTIVSIKPCGFLIEEENKFNLVKLQESIEESSMNKILDLISNLQAN